LIERILLPLSLLLILGNCLAAIDLVVTDVQIIDITDTASETPAQTDSLYKDTEFFNVKVLVRNLSSGQLTPRVNLKFLDSATNQEITLESDLQPDLQHAIEPVEPGEEASTTFTHILLKDEPAFEANRHYWVRAELRPSANADDSKGASLTILKSPGIAIPETSPFIVVLIAFAVLFITSGKMRISEAD